MLIQFLLVNILFKGINSAALYNEEAAVSRQELACCEGEEFLSCQPIAINITALGDQELDLLILNKTLAFKGMVGESINSYHYGSTDADVVITLHNGDVYGHAALVSGESFVIENCGNGVHVVKKLDVDTLGENVGVDLESNDSVTSRRLKPNGSTITVKPIKPVQPILPSSTTTVTYTVKVYYTPQFAAVTADIEGFIEQVIEETNQGYINSGALLRVAVCSIEQATINDGLYGEEMLNTFKDMKGTTEALRGTSDATVLLVNSFDSCGIAYKNSISSGETISVIRKSCALGYYSFGHEIGHNIGLQGDLEENSAYPFGHGHLIEQGTALTGYRTIMAFYAPGHATRVNYYSNPEITFPVTGTTTGISEVSDNVQVLNENRFDLAAIGDESECLDDTPTENCVLEGYIGLTYSNLGAMSRSECFVQCAIEPTCIYWIYRNVIDSVICYLRKFSTSSSSDIAGPDLTKPCCHLDFSCITDDIFLGLTAFSTIQTSDAASCHTICKSTTGCVFWQWNQPNNPDCEMWQRNEFSSNFYDSGTKYC